MGATIVVARPSGMRGTAARRSGTVLQGADPVDIALYIGPNRYQIFMESLAETGRDVDLEGNKEAFLDAAPDTLHEDDEGEGRPRPIYGAGDVDDRWTVLHWASYNGSPKVKRLLPLKGADPEHLDAITLDSWRRTRHYCRQVLLRGVDLRG